MCVEAISAQLVTTVVWCLSLVVFPNTAPAAVKYILCIFPNSALSFAFSVMYQFERSGNVVIHTHIYNDFLDQLNMPYLNDLKQGQVSHTQTCSPTCTATALCSAAF